VVFPISEQVSVFQGEHTLGVCAPCGRQLTQHHCPTRPRPTTEPFRALAFPILGGEPPSCLQTMPGLQD
jgi:hypothetical protein